VAIGALGPGQSDTANYQLNTSCQGLKVHAEVPQSAAGPRGISSLELYPCAPELQLLFGGYADADRGLAFVVTNIGGVPAQPTTVRVEKIAPASAAGDARDLGLPPLAPGQSFWFYYSLGTGLCPGGLQVRATVTQDPNANPADNSITSTVCDNVGQIAPDLSVEQRTGARNGIPPIVTAPASTAPKPGDEPNNAPGEHSMDLNPSAFGWGVDSHDAAPDCLLLPTPDQAPVGLLNYLGSQCLWETAVRFDLTSLDQIPIKTVTGARLTFDEAIESQPVVGIDLPSCVSELAIATSQWPAASGNSPRPSLFDAFPSQFYAAVSGQDVDVTAAVERSALHVPPLLGTSGNVRYGFILRTLDSIDEAQPDGPATAFCGSYLSNLTLHVTYVVPQNP
jgi:hypothetical protein